VSTFQKARGQAPSHVEILQPSAFADEWEHRPTSPVSVGLRLLSETDYETATIAAATFAVDAMTSAEGRSRVDGATFDDVYNARIMLEGVARAICDPANARSAHRLFPLPQDQLEAGHMTPETIRFLWDVLGRKRLELSPIAPIAADEDLRRLAAHLRAGSLARLPRDEQVPARKLLAAVLERLDAFAPGIDADDEAEEEDDDEVDGVPTYRVTAAT